MIRSSWVSLALRCALFAAAALALWLFSGAAWVPASLVLAAYGAILELAQARDADPPPPPHVCPSGFGDPSHEEVYAALLLADAQVEANAATDFWLSGNGCCHISRQVAEARRHEAWSRAKARAAEYQELRDRRIESVRK